MKEFIITKANSLHTSDIMNLYSSLIGCLGCTWNKNYPNIEDVKNDIEKDSLYIVIYKEDKIVAAAAAGKDDELKSISCWSSEIGNPCSLSRVGVQENYQHKGIAKKLIKYIEKDALVHGFDGIHFLAAKTNYRALSLYDKLGYCVCGECVMYDIEWFCYEKKF